ncbi:MAG: hypothetical protein M0Q12_01065 [Synergistaceae bacterium]|jgi:hypothetical protein|nr:hypothetical protein [Synergistaceae bacterium]
MGCKNTCYITKSVAQQVLMSSIIIANDSELEAMLQALPESTFRNYIIDDCGDDRDDLKTIISVKDFYEKLI